MAEERWNRINIPFPSAVSSVRIPFSNATGLTLNNIQEENIKVLKLLKSQVLQTEIRVLYELLYAFKNAFRQHKPFRVLKQIEQCINRLKEMKLETALLDLRELCPNHMQRQLAIKVGQCPVPSQPMLEWLCLKVLGASSLMRCLLHHCTRAFILARQHLRCKEFIIFNVILTSMVSRLWVFFRGILGTLAPLYQQLLGLLQEVSQVQLLPSLGDFTLPLDITQFLGPSDLPALVKRELPHAGPGSPWLTRLSEGEETKQLGGLHRANTSRRIDLGEAVLFQRMGDSDVPGFNVKALVKQTHGIITEVSIESEQFSSQGTITVDQKRKFLKPVKAAGTFSAVSSHLGGMLRWCKRQRLPQETRRLAFLHLSCRRMKHLEAAGYSVQRKLRSYKLQVRWALAGKQAPPRTWQEPITMWRRAHPKTRLRLIKKEVGVHRKLSDRRRQKSAVLSFVDPLENLSEQKDLSDISRSEKVYEPSEDTTPCANLNDIDDIFASLDF
ncbi:nucleolus and neural progenitor protein [Osmerus eperlanus]|uniref:nucleolus and neural progenitor protein n=1 Tax=Osmerus eperlanus TaxID=29151 RepID=UPI002E105AAA